MDIVIAAKERTEKGKTMEDSKDFFARMIVTNEEMQCKGYMDFLLHKMKERIANGILDIVSDGNEYVIKMLPEQRIKKPDMLNMNPVEIRQGISVKELVRCMDCKHYDEKCGSCKKSDIIRSDMRIIMPYWYCADGERKEQDDATN